MFPRILIAWHENTVSLLRDSHWILFPMDSEFCWTSGTWQSNKTTWESRSWTASESTVTIWSKGEYEGLEGYHLKFSTFANEWCTSLPSSSLYGFAIKLGYTRCQLQRTATLFINHWKTIKSYSRLNHSIAWLTLWFSPEWWLQGTVKATLDWTIYFITANFPNRVSLSKTVHSHKEFLCHGK